MLCVFGFFGATLGAQMARRLTQIIVFLIPLAAWPGVERPFSMPKLILIASLVLLGAGWMLVNREKPKASLTGAQMITYLAWLATLALSALTGELVSLGDLLLLLLPALCFPIILSVQVENRALSVALGLSSVAVSATAVLQFAGMDPFRLLGWMPEPGGSQRLLVYGTLGNPNFVAAFLSGCLPLLVALLFSEEFGRGSRHQWLWMPAVVLNLAALLATGSRSPALAFFATLPMIVLLVTRNAKRRRQPGGKAARLASIGSSRTVVGTLILVLASGIVFLSPARPLAATVGGRAHIVRTVLRNLGEVPLFGFGPGAFSVKYYQWETDHLRDNPEEATSPFRGPQDHAHNDYLEVLINQGPVGLFTLIALLLVIAGAAFRSAPDHFALAALTGAAALLAIALVDFPLHRPAESFLLWTLFAVALRSRARTTHFSQDLATQGD